MARFLLELHGQSSRSTCPACGRGVALLVTRGVSVLVELRGRLAVLHQCGAVDAAPRTWPAAGRGRPRQLGPEEVEAAACRRRDSEGPGGAPENA